MKHSTRIIIMLILGILTILLLLRLGNIEISLETLQRINPVYFGLALLIHYSGFAVRGWRWQSLLKGLGHRLSWGYTTTLLLAGWFVSALIPARAGDLGRAYILRRDHDITMSQGFASIATERALDIFTILLLALLAASLALAGRTPSWVWQSIGGGAVAFVIAGLLLLTVPKLETWLRSLLPWSLTQKILTFGFELLASVRQLLQKPLLLLLVMAHSTYIWVCDILLMYFALLSIGVVAPLSVSAVAAMIADLAAAVPIVPGAMGQFEGAALFTLSLFNINPSDSSLMLLINRFISFWSFILFSGLITYLFGFAQALKMDTLSPSEATPKPQLGE